MDDSAINCGEVTNANARVTLKKNDDETKSIPTNVNEK